MDNIIFIMAIKNNIKLIQVIILLSAIYNINK